MKKSSIFIVGAGNVGAALGQCWLAEGYSVHFGVPDPGSPKYTHLPQGSVRSIHDRRDADIIVLAVPFLVVQSVLEALGDLSDIIVVDCTNPLAFTNNDLQLSLGFETSGAELIARWARGAYVFKTLNQTGAENLVDADAFSSRPMMFVAGDDNSKKRIVMDLVKGLGFEAIDSGPPVTARLLEPLAMLWIELAMKLGHTRGFAFAKVRHREAESG